MQPSSTYSCFIQALNVMNAALELHRDSPIFRPILSLAEAELAGCDLVVSIVPSNDAPLPEDYVTIRIQQGAFVLVAHGKTSDSTAWKVSQRYLSDVATNPRRYLDDPGRLDFDWLKLLVGLSPQMVSRAGADS